MEFSPQHHLIAGAVVLALFVAAVIGLVVMMRRARRAAELEHAERVIAEAYDDLERPTCSRPPDPRS